MEKFILISIGAIFGANVRYWIGDWAAQKFGTSFPYGTLIINLTGSFILGLFMTLISDRLFVDPRLRLLFVVGFLGAYTTFSTYTYESFSLISKSQWLPGLLDLFGSTILGVIAVGLGVLIGKLL